MIHAVSNYLNVMMIKFAAPIRDQYASVYYILSLQLVHIRKNVKPVVSQNNYMCTCTNGMPITVI